ncbi:hypothetical protein V6R21_04750 [Limibacter armeniacum]|uniref:hypothetical protein n=1 Tax=Limibacter armeniacum TaxID=466084 RepID=UPI002FE53585
MKISITYLLIAAASIAMFFGCQDQGNSTKVASVEESVEPILADQIQGSWKLVQAETQENGSVTYKDLSSTDFIKIINGKHFAFFNQSNDEQKVFYGGAGVYSLEGNQYTETLSFTGIEEMRGHQFTFELEVKGDSLIQSGWEIVEEQNIKRHIVEKYVKL